MPVDIPEEPPVDRNPDPWLPGDLADPPPLHRPAATVWVSRYDADAGTYFDLPNVRCVFVEQKTGPMPGVAGFRYVFPYPSVEAPQDFSQALSGDFSGDLVVVEGDRLVVRALRPDSEVRILFDGHALDFGLALAGDQERVDIHAVGVGRRAKDSVIGGAYIRDASDPTDATKDVQTDLLAVFNPRGKANASPADADAGDGDQKYPTFLDAGIPDLGQRKWTLAMAARYILFRHNADEDFVQNPTGTTLDGLLVARVPIDGTPFDINDPASYDQRDIVVPPKTLNGRDWPGLFHEYIRVYGFEMCYHVAANVDGTPYTRLRTWHRMAPDPKDIWLQPRGSQLDGRLSNVGYAQLRRDLTDVITNWTVDGGLERYEGSFVLAPEFPCYSADGATASAMREFDRSSPTWPDADKDAYRKYILDESGEGHYAVGTATESTTKPDLHDLIGEADYATRRRKPLGDLITTGPDGKPLKYRLAYSTDYAGLKPGLWDGTGTWKPIQRGFYLLKDQVGIYVDIDNPNHWIVGEAATGEPLTLKGIEDQCAVAAGKNFHLRLTCVVEGDATVKGFATSSGYSPLADLVYRRIDARDRYRKETIGIYSEFNNTDTAVVKRDDTDDAEAEAVMHRATTEAGVLEGSVVIPYLTDYYELGDPIRRINGRGLGFRTDGGTDSTPLYPIVEGRRLELEDGQRTVLMLSDESQSRTYLERKLRKM
jgi:hypothetical protein